ncbi:MAG: hypothetical protein ACREX3_25190 [Gammaproteobacteria bacterium]
MTQGAKGVLEAYEALPREEREAVLVELLRRVAQSDHEVPSETELVELADQVFVEYDRSESEA